MITNSVLYMPKVNIKANLSMFIISDFSDIFKNYKRMMSRHNLVN